MGAAAADGRRTQDELEKLHRWLVELLWLRQLARDSHSTQWVDKASYEEKLLATLAQSARTRQRVASAGREGAQCRGVVEPLRAMADSPSRGGSTSVKDGTTKPRKLWSTTGTREQAVRHKAIRPRLLDSAAGCGKPHVQWCWRTDGRHPVSSPRSLA